MSVLYYPELEIVNPLTPSLLLLLFLFLWVNFLENLPPIIMNQLVTFDVFISSYSVSTKVLNGRLSIYSGLLSYVLFRPNYLFYH